VTFAGNLRVRRYESVKKELEDLQMRFCKGGNNRERENRRWQYEQSNIG
jgi:hypothetical protein